MIGFALGRGGDEPRPTDPHDHEHDPAEATTPWTCSMHPQIKLPEPGLCPICNMDLIPLTGGGDGDAPRLEMSEAARALADIRTTPVVRDRPVVEVRLSGVVVPDDTRSAAIISRVAGRLDRLYVDTLGETVRRGDPLAEIFSPELLHRGPRASPARRFGAGPGEAPPPWTG